MPDLNSSTISIEGGLISGNDGDVRSYKGIPYAAPPVGELRWRPPQPVQAWDGVRAATQYGFDPMQNNPVRQARSLAPGISEDCLTLNVWTSSKPGDKPAPVMIWFHGGGFNSGSGADPQCAGESLARKGVVVVTANYRLGVFGFLAHPELTAESPHHASSNYGFLDKIAALQWIKNNIAKFGGDPGRVTAFGQSAGGASVALFLISPLAKGLFHQVILESGGTGRPLSTLDNAEKTGLTVGTDIAALRRMPADELVKMNAKYAVAARGLTSPRLLRPIMDGWSVPVDERPALLAGEFDAVPMIIGTSINEGNISGGLATKTVESYEEFMRQNFGAMTEEALSLYPVKNGDEIPREITFGLGDTQFQYGVRTLASASAKKQPKTFRYVFSYPTSPGRIAKHEDEIPFVFGTLEAVGQHGARTPTAEDWVMAEKMQDAWVRFATTGDPNGGDLPAWPAYDPETDPYLDLGATIAAKNDFRRPQMDFLDRFFSQPKGE